jgi:ketosteroid isomerase-like protein
VHHTDSHRELAHRVWDATARGDVDTLLQIYAPDVVMWVRGRNPLCGEYKGTTALLGQFARSAELLDELCLDLQEVYSSEDGALLRYRVEASRGELRLDAEFHLSFRVAAGRIYEVEIVATDPKRTDAFWHEVVGS